MRLKIAQPTLQCSLVLPQSFPSPNPTSPINSSSSSTKSTKRNTTFLYKFSVLTTWPSTKLLKSRSFNKPISTAPTMKRACSHADFDDFSHEDLSEIIQNFELSEDENTTTWSKSVVGTEEHRTNLSFRASLFPSKLGSLEPFTLGIEPEPPQWPEREELIWAIIERRANSVDFPLSLRIIKKKQQWQEGFGGLGESTSCSVKKTFSSMVFIILELQSHALKMREFISYEDLEKIKARVHREMYASFAWLFEQVFSRTPSLMICLMILLADFSIYSMSHNTAIQDNSLLSTLCEATENVSALESMNQLQFESFSRKICGGGNVHSLPDDLSGFSWNEDCKISEKDAGLWGLVVDEATRMQEESRGGVVDHDTMQSLVSPVLVELEPDDYTEYYRTDLLYQMGLSQDPNNSLLLCNYAQFLHLVANDHDSRAEECFKRAIQVEPYDAEALSRYANFLWIVRKDLWGAEERFLEAIAAEPENPFHASKYANFLWSTGGTDDAVTRARA
ncbi:uncharacterized protein LOC114269074 isoform X1 [Camellia sinensis]|uniref:uncharacterized protein LOC114269074 isoform X1 n=1 Tax=Camellia sinensis TaxID=4442 RepID=UPI0010366D56|nr:uncharacterized protein LOC114269074 isoform X1 [Camellia sinensis]